MFQCCIRHSKRKSRKICICERRIMDEINCIWAKWKECYVAYKIKLFISWEMELHFHFKWKREKNEVRSRWIYKFVCVCVVIESEKERRIETKCFLFFFFCSPESQDRFHKQLHKTSVVVYTFCVWISITYDGNIANYNEFTLHI